MKSLVPVTSQLELESLTLVVPLVHRETRSKLSVVVVLLQTGRNLRARQPRPAAPANAAQRVASLLSNAREARVSVEGLPRDIKQDAVRVC